jgi:hypothetical protein
MTRFHNKYHKRNHHTTHDPAYPDSASDPIASADNPFQGTFFINGDLSATGTIYGLASLTTPASADVSQVIADVAELSSFTLALDTRVETLSVFALALDTRIETLSTFVDSLVSPISSFKLTSIYNGVFPVSTTVTYLSSGNAGQIVEATESTVQTFYVPDSGDDFSQFDANNVPFALDIVQIGTAVFNISASAPSTLIGNAVSSGQGTAISIYRRPSTNTFVLIGGTT